MFFFCETKCGLTGLPKKPWEAKLDLTWYYASQPTLPLKTLTAAIFVCGACFKLERTQHMSFSHPP